MAGGGVLAGEERSDAGNRPRNQVHLTIPKKLVSYQNSFNHSLFLVFQGLLRAKGLAGAVKTTDKNGYDIKFGVLVGSNQPFTRAYPVIASALAAANTRRNSLPGSHPYEQNTRKKARHLKKKEQVVLAAALRTAYADIIAVGSKA